MDFETSFFFFLFPPSAGHSPKRLVGGFLSAWIKLGKSLLAHEYITQRGTEKVFEEDGIQREKGGKKKPKPTTGNNMYY